MDMAEDRVSTTCACCTPGVYSVYRLHIGKRVCTQAARNQQEGPGDLVQAGVVGQIAVAPHRRGHNIHPKRSALGVDLVDVVHVQQEGDGGGHLRGLVRIVVQKELALQAVGVCGGRIAIGALLGLAVTLQGARQVQGQQQHNEREVEAHGAMCCKGQNPAASTVRFCSRSRHKATQGSNRVQLVPSAHLSFRPTGTSEPGKTSSGLRWTPKLSF